MFLSAKKQMESQAGANICPRKERSESLTGGQVLLPAICFCKRLIPNVFLGGKHQPAVHAAAYNGKIFMAKDKKVRDTHHVHISPGQPC